MSSSTWVLLILCSLMITFYAYIWIMVMIEPECPHCHNKGSYKAGNSIRVCETCGGLFHENHP